MSIPKFYVKFLADLILFYESIKECILRKELLMRDVEIHYAS